MKSSVAVSLALLPLAAHAASYSLVQNYTGSSFFDDWDFVSGIDGNTTGNVLYQSKTQATSENLAYVNSAGNAIIKVDNTTVGTGDTYGRASIKMTSKTTVKEGSLILMDAVHLPYGCSVWPAFWTQGFDWPNNGEIDIFENVNLASANQYTLHTLQGCTNPGNSSAQTGIVEYTDCYNATNGNSGCAVRESKSNSYGAGFANNGGGALAAQWNSDGISTWFFPRGSVPSDFTSSSPNPTSWGTPSAYWPSSSCSMSKYFGEQTLIFDITLCGNFAGLANVFNETCSGVCTDLIKTPTNYDTAYFEIKYLSVFNDGSSNSSSSSSTQSAASTTSISNSVIFLLVIGLIALVTS